MATRNSSDIPTPDAVTRRTFLGTASAALIACAAPASAANFAAPAARPSGATLTILPEDGRTLYLQAIDSATRAINIEICVLEDPEILEHIQSALERGVAVRAIVDARKYNAIAAEREHLDRYLVTPGGQLHLSNPIFPRSFPKIILIDTGLLVFGSACLDQTTFLEYRDFATTCTDPQVLHDLHALFENDWAYSAPPGQSAPAFNPTSPFSSPDLLLSPVNAADQLVRLYQSARSTIEVYSEILGNLTLESELAAAVTRGVRVRMISPFYVNGLSHDDEARQLVALQSLSAAGVEIHSNGRQTLALPYMHARADIIDGNTGFLGSISLSPDSVTLNREMGLLLRDPLLIQQLLTQFEKDYAALTPI